MQRITIKQARTGMCLSRSVPHPRRPEEAMLQAGTIITAKDIALLHEQGAYDLWVHYPGTAFLDDLITPDLTRPQRRLCEALRDSFLRYGCLEQGSGMMAAAHAVEEVMHTVVRSEQLRTIVAALGAVDELLLNHSADACVLGILLGQKLGDYIMEQRRRFPGRQPHGLLNLALGCLFHDVGELQLPEPQRESRLALALNNHTGDEWKAHAELGYQALKKHMEPSAANVILHHHQHFDGSGFATCDGRPIMQSGASIHIFSRIAMAADTFLHAVNSVTGGAAHPTVRALGQIQQHPCKPWFDPAVLSALLEIVPPFMPGMVVHLTDGQQAVVTRTRRESPCYPVVQVLHGPAAFKQENGAPGEEVLDLAQSMSLRVFSVDGSFIESHLYGPRIPSQAARRLSA